MVKSVLIFSFVIAVMVSAGCGNENRVASLDDTAATPKCIDGVNGYYNKSGHCVCWGMVVADHPCKD